METVGVSVGQVLSRVGASPLDNPRVSEAFGWFLVWSLVATFLFALGLGGYGLLSGVLGG